MEAQLLYDMKLIIGDEALAETEADTDGHLDELLWSYLLKAAEAILCTRYPFRRPEHAEVEPRFYQTQVEIAVYLFNKRGAENESLHSENGISRSYGADTGIPKSLLARITPMGMVR